MVCACFAVSWLSTCNSDSKCDYCCAVCASVDPTLTSCLSPRKYFNAAKDNGTVVQRKLSMQAHPFSFWDCGGCHKIIQKLNFGPKCLLLLLHGNSEHLFQLTTNFSVALFLGLFVQKQSLSRILLPFAGVACYRHVTYHVQVSWRHHEELLVDGVNVVPSRGSYVWRLQ